MAVTPQPNYSFLPFGRNSAKEIVSTWSRLLGYRQPEELAAGKKLFYEGEAAIDVFLLVDGLVLLTCSASQEDEEGSLGLRLPGQIIEQCAHSLSLPYSVSAKTVTDSKIFRIPVPELQRKKLEDPAVGLFFERALALDLYHSAMFINTLRFLRRRSVLKASFISLLPQPEAKLEAII